MKHSNAYLWGKRKTGQLLKIDFVRFGIVGVIGFLVTLVLKVTVFKQLDVFVATFLSSEGGMISNFFFHENWTYNNVDHSSNPILKKFWHFQLSSLSGVLLITLINGGLIKYLHLSVLLSLAIAAGVTMFWNYFWTKFFIFKGRTPAILLDPEDTVPVVSREKP
jgi:putative flippase GtrA